MEHQVKIRQCHLIHILKGRKKFEIRRNDRDYQVGDTLAFLPLEDENYDAYKVESPLPKFKITYLHYDLGMAAGYVAMAIARKPGESNASGLPHQTGANDGRQTMDEDE